MAKTALNKTRFARLYFSEAKQKKDVLANGTTKEREAADKLFRHHLAAGTLDAVTVEATIAAYLREQEAELRKWLAGE
jgi:hypothetical protein